MSTLSEIQTQARFFARNEVIDITAEPGLSIFNGVYQHVVTLKKYPEFRFKRELDTTVDTTASYTWSIVVLVDCGTASTTDTLTIDCGTASSTDTELIDCGDAFSGSAVTPYNVTAIEVETSATSGIMEMTFSPDSEDIWSEVAKDDDGQPYYWVRNNATPVVEFRPAPDFTGGEIRVTGYDEPDELNVSTQETRFLGSTIDDVIARLVAAEYLERAGMPGADSLRQAGIVILKKFGEEIEE